MANIDLETLFVYTYIRFMKSGKRNIRTYKITDKDYVEGFNMAKKNDRFLSQLIEQFVIDMKNGRLVFEGNQVVGFYGILASMEPKAKHFKPKPSSPVSTKK